MRTVNESTGRKVKIGGEHAWVYPITPKHSRSPGCIATLLKYFKLYCKNSSLTGCKYLVEDETTWIERILWIMVYGIALTFLLIMVRSGYYDFLAAPIATIPDPDNFPTYRLQFPGISICPINRISRISTTILAHEIVDDIMSLLQQMGGLYESPFTIENRHYEMHQLLTKLEGFLDVTEIMKRLAPQCTEFLLICMFHGKKRNCSDMFAFRKTQDGFCCTFNYMSEPDDMPEFGDTEELLHTFEQVEKVVNLGLNGGITVVVDNRLNDTLYQIYPIEGLKVIITDPLDYPDITSGGATEVLVPPLSEKFIEVDAVSFYSTDDIRSYPVQKRQCIFPNERGTQSKRVFYSYSDCIVDCKVADIWKICRCRPFYFTRRGEAEYNQRTCSIVDIPCLAKNKYRWHNVLPHLEAWMLHDNYSGLLQCHSCYPSCEDISYTVSSFSSSLETGLYRTPLMDNFDLDDECIVHIYFTNLGAVRLKQDVVFQWYELLSEMGGVCGVFVGFSLIGGIELLYFTALLILELSGVTTNPVGSETPLKTTPVQTIYWAELFPRSRLPLKMAQLNENSMLHSTN